MDGTVQAEIPASLLERARQALSTAEQQETEARHRLALLELQDEQLSVEVRRGVEKAARREDLSREKAEQWQVLRGVRERLLATRRMYDELRRHALDLQHTIRREERAVTLWQRQIKNTEEQLARWQRILVEAQARLEQAQRELADLTGFVPPGS